MKERNYKGLVIFDIDNNGDNYESFQKAVKLFREEYDIKEILINHFKSKRLKK